MQSSPDAASRPRAERDAKAARRWSMMLSVRTAPPGLSARESCASTECRTHPRSVRRHQRWRQAVERSARASDEPALVNGRGYIFLCAVASKGSAREQGQRPRSSPLRADAASPAPISRRASRFHLPPTLHWRAPFGVRRFEPAGRAAAHSGCGSSSSSRSGSNRRRPRPSTSLTCPHRRQPHRLMGGVLGGAKPR